MMEHVDKVKHYLTAYRCMLCMRKFGLARELLEHNKLEHAELEDEVSRPEIITLDSDCEVESIQGAVPSQLVPVVPVPSVIEPQPPQPPVVGAPVLSERISAVSSPALSTPTLSSPALSTSPPSEKMISTLPPVVSAPALSEMIGLRPHVSDVSPRPFLAGHSKIRLGPLTWPAGPQHAHQPCRFRLPNGPVGPSLQQPNVSFILMRPRQPEPAPFVHELFAPAGLVGHAPNPGAAVSAAPVRTVVPAVVPAVVPTLSSASPPLEPAATPPSPASLGPAVAEIGAKNNADPVCRAEVTSTTLNEVIAHSIKSRTPNSRRSSLILARKRSSASTRPCQKPALPRRQKTAKARAAPLLARPRTKPRVGPAPNSNIKYVSILKPISKPASPDSPQVELETGEMNDITSTSEEDLALTLRLAAPEPPKGVPAPVHLAPPSDRTTPEVPAQPQDGVTAVPARPGDDTTTHSSDLAGAGEPPRPLDGANAVLAAPTAHPSDRVAPEVPPQPQDGGPAVLPAPPGDDATTHPSGRAAPEAPPRSQDGATAGGEDATPRPSRRALKRSARPGPASKKRPRTAPAEAPGGAPLEQPPTQPGVKDEQPLEQPAVKEEKPLEQLAVKEQEDNALATPVASEELQGEGAVTPRHSLRPRSRTASSNKQQLLRSATSETGRRSITPPPLEPLEHRDLLEALVPLDLLGFLEEPLDFPVSLGAQDGEPVEGEGSSELPPVRQLRLARPRPASKQTGAVCAPATPPKNQPAEPQPLLVPKLEDPSSALGPRRGRPPSTAAKKGSAPARRRPGPASKKTRVVQAPTGESSTATASVKRKAPSRRPGSVISVPKSGQQPWIERAMQDHTRKLEGSTIRACNFCDFNAKYSQRLIFHVLNHMKLHPSKTCLVCGASFKQISLLKVHRTVVHNTAIYQCADCDHGRFETKQALRRHIELVQCFNKSV